MSSDSDSDDQFESADEEFDFDIEEEEDTLPQSKSSHEVTKQVAHLSLKEKSVEEINSSKSEKRSEDTQITSSENVSQPIPDIIESKSVVEIGKNESKSVVETGKNESKSVVETGEEKPKIPDPIPESKSRVEICKEKSPNIENRSIDHVTKSTSKAKEFSFLKDTTSKSIETNKDDMGVLKTNRKNPQIDSEPKYGKECSFDQSKTEQSNTILTSIPDTIKSTEKEPINISVTSTNEPKSSITRTNKSIDSKESSSSDAKNKSEDMKVNEKDNPIKATEVNPIKATEVNPITKATEANPKATEIHKSIKEPSLDIEIDGWDSVDIDDDINDLLPSTQDGEFTTNKQEAGDQRGILEDKKTTSENRVDNVKSKSSLKEEIIKDIVVNSGADTDGWDVDVEVEDGFEIPVNLNKATSGTSQSTHDRFPFSLTSPLQKLSDSKEDSWGGWGGAWGGMGNILSTATTGVSTLTSQVSQGFTQVLGAPDPAELAKQLNEMEQQKAEQAAQSATPEPSTTESASAETQSASTGLFSLSQLTRLVETTGSKVIAGGLDTLENLGKKTMEVLQDGDPGLKRKRAILFPNQDKPVLSQVLRDAKSRQESQDRNESRENVSSFPLSSSQGPNTSNTINVQNLHFETLLDDYQGLSHLEALEILSKQCSLKLHNALMGEQDQQMNDYQETLQQIREMCQVDDATNIDDNEEEEDEEEEMGFEEKIEEIVRLYDLRSKLNCDKLIKVNKKIVLQVDRLPLESSCDKLYSQCLHSMAEFTSIAMELFHKSASLLLLKSKHRTVDETDALTQLTHLLCSRITKLSSAYSQSMMKLNTDSPLITNIYLEAANSCSYLQDASQLLIPVLQIVALPPSGGGGGGGGSLL